MFHALLTLLYVCLLLDVFNFLYQLAPSNIAKILAVVKRGETERARLSLLSVKSQTHKNYLPVIVDWQKFCSDSGIVDEYLLDFSLKDKTSIFLAFMSVRSERKQGTTKVVPALTLHFDIYGANHDFLIDPSVIRSREGGAREVAARVNKRAALQKINWTREMLDQAWYLSSQGVAFGPTAQKGQQLHAIKIHYMILCAMEIQLHSGCRVGQLAADVAQHELHNEDVSIQLSCGTMLSTKEAYRIGEFKLLLQLSAIFYSICSTKVLASVGKPLPDGFVLVELPESICWSQPRSNCQQIESRDD